MKLYFKYLIRNFFIWSLALSFFSVMRQFGQEVVVPFSDPPNLLQYIRAHFSLGIIAGLLYGTLEYIFDKKIYKRMSLGRMILLSTSSYLFVTMVLIFFGINIFTKVLGVTLNWETLHEFLNFKELLLITFYCFLVGTLVDFVKQVDKKLGPGNLWKMMKGEFYNPKEDERVFMFLDLKSSTAIAEKLGHLQYSQFIQDCFQDLAVVEQYEAEVYQYVGDEAVLTWKKETGLENSNCLRAFFDFKSRLTERSDFYMKKYGLVPEFKAGLNIGKITVAEVGQTKTEIAYHGDTINTASRIQDECNRLGRTLLISEELKNSLIDIQGFASSYVGDVLLKGKSKAINLYSVESLTS